MPETQSGGFGVVRTLVRDATDAPQAAGAETWLDSDNTVSQSDAANRSTGSTLLVCRVSAEVAVSKFVCCWLRPPADQWIKLYSAAARFLLSPDT